MDSEKSFIALIEQSIKKNWNADALTDYKGATLQFKDVARKIEKIHSCFKTHQLGLISYWSSPLIKINLGKSKQ